MLKKITKNQNEVAPTEIIRQVEKLYKNKNFDEALVIALEIIKKYPKTIIIQNILGIIFFNQNNLNLSLHHFREVLKIDSSNSDAYNNIGICLIEMKNYKDAIKILEYALLNNKKAPEVLNNIGIAYEELEDYENSIIHYKKAISQKQNYAEAYNNMGSVLHKMKNYSEAKEILSYAIKLDPKLENAYQNMGKLNSILGNFKIAKTEFQKAIKLNPKNYQNYNELGKVYLQENNFEIAKLNFEKVININPGFAETYYYLGDIYLNTGFISKAFKYLRQNSISDDDLEKKFIYLSLIHFLTLNWIDNPKSYYLPRIMGKIENKNIAEFTKDYGIDNKRNNFKKIYEQIYGIIPNDKINKVKNKTEIVALLGFGRSGSLFLHSLLDGHPQISTLPGYFFKGWFSVKTWPIFQPNYGDINWRETLVEKICTYFEPQFNARCKKNVIGKPNGEAEWFAENLGFTQLGKNQSEILELDQQKFKSKFIDLSKAYDKIDSRICFELIHEAFDKAYRIQENPSQEDKIIFYHLHNPSYFERASFHYHYPNSKSLFIIRHPIQMLESWLLADIASLPSLLEENHSFRDNYNFIKILSCGDKICSGLEYFLNPLNSKDNVRGIKLEDLKRNPKKTLKSISKWIGIKDNTTLYESTFMDMSFSRPSSNFNNIQGFDTQSIDVCLGRIFGERDIIILETLFWPFMKMYGYTKMTEEKFLENISGIRPYLDEPFQFEVELYKKLPSDKPDIGKIYNYNKLHRELIKIWEILNETKTYPNLIKPLVI